MPGRSAAKETSRSGLRESARIAPETARLNGSVGDSLAGVLPLIFEAIWLFSLSPLLRREGRGEGQLKSAQRDVHRAFRQLDAEAALIELGDDRTLELVALVEEGEPEGEAEVVEDLGVLRPGDHRARAHHGRQVAVHEGVAREVGDADHLADGVAA